MLSCEDYVLAHVRRIYGAKIFYRNRIFYIKTSDDIYRLDFRLAEESIYRFISMSKPMVLTETNLARGFFRVAAHSTYKETKQIPTYQDWKRFLNDAYKYGVKEKG